MKVEIEDSWKKALKDEFELPYFTMLTKAVRAAYLGNEPVYPPPQFVFNAFALCPFDTVKVIILGQDPYHGPHQAHGLSFSVRDGTDIPPSLKNIYKELHEDIGLAPKQSGDLTPWATQGVLLLNATLTVVHGKPNSHQGLGWERFTDAVVKKLSDEKEHLVFILWGKYAKKKGLVVDPKKHLIIQSAHPSPLSAHNGFFGSKPFSTANAYLTKHGYTPLEW